MSLEKMKQPHLKSSISGYLNNMTASGLEMISENSHIKMGILILKIFLPVVIRFHYTLILGIYLQIIKV